MSAGLFPLVARPSAPPLPSIDHVTPLPRATRDVALDLVRGLAIVILIVNHLHLESPLEVATSAALSAAEMLVAVSGVVVGMVFGRRWLTRGARATTLMLLRRARTLYLASVVVVALVGLLTLVPGAATEALVVSRGADTYSHDGVLATLWAVVTLEAGPWQFNIMSFFVTVLVLSPPLLWLLARGWWPAVLALSWGAYLGGRAWPVEVLPSQSEQAFPLLVWQLLFVHGLLLGWYRDRLAAATRGRGRWIAGGVLALAAVSLWASVRGPGLSWDQWAAFESAHYDKDSLDPARVAAMMSMTAAVYLLFRRFAAACERALGWLLLPLGRSSFYVFIVQVFVCLLAASLPVVGGDGIGPVGNALLQAGCVLLLWGMVRRRLLFGWIPR